MHTATQRRTRSLTVGRGAGGTGKNGEKRPPGKPARRDLFLNIAAVAVTVCIVAACGVWIYGVRFYVVSSNSMAPTFEGSETSRDRIVCWMLPGLYRQPRRWEVVIFRTPPTAKGQEAFPGMFTAEEEGITLKRMVGLPGERLAFADGDIWTRPPEGGNFVRRVKPEDVQRDVWIGVYREDFSDATLDEFLHFWHASDRDAMTLAPGSGLLRMAAGSSLRYKPLSRDTGGRLPELPGIPDRYVLSQDALFDCSRCSASFTILIDNQKIQGRCPACGQLNFENSVSVYGFRSGLPDIGRHSAGDVIEVDRDMLRDFPYYFVSDLRVVLELMPETAYSACQITLSNDDGPVSLAAGPAGLFLDGTPLHGAAALPIGEWTTVEFHRADGRLRIYLNADSRAVYDQPHGSQTGSDADRRNQGNAVAVRAASGGIAVRHIAVDRDIHYFSGREKAIGNYLGSVGEDGEIDVPAGKFLPLGDNTTVSFDGRSWGAIDESLLMGTATAIWLPESRRRLIH